MPRIKQRQVFYIHGFDPRGAGHYHRLYRNQSARQQAVNGLDITVSRRQRRSAHSHHWQLSTPQTQTDYCYLGWDDIIRRHWARGWREILSDIACFLGAYVLSGRCIAFAKVSPKQLMAGFYPAVYLLLSLLISTWLAITVAGLLPWKTAHLPAGLVLLALLMQASKYLGNRLAVFWLLRIYAFSARWAKGQIPELEPRINTFAKQITEAIDNHTNDEIVIIAHSVGTMVVVPALAQALQQVQNPARLANHRVVLITLGHCIPLLSFQPAAAEFRAALQQLGQAHHLLWLDYTAPTDGACFPLLDPVTSCGLPRGAHAGPRLLSPRFFTLYHPPHYKQLRRAWYRMHFLYLMATDKAGPYDYFAFTAGPLPIARQIEEQP